MKKLHVILLGLLIAGGVVAGENQPDADQKWTATVEKMIAAGPATISTPSKSRVEIARKLAAKAGRKAEVERTEQGFRIKVS